MARKTKTVIISAAGRDQGKHFLLTEMSAVRAESWGLRALLALAHGGVDIPEGFMDAGIAGMAVMGVEALGRLRYEDAAPLLDEMLAQVQIIPDPVGNRALVTRPLMAEEDIEEITTLVQLRKEIIGLHIDFFTDAGLWSKARESLKAAGV